MTQLAQRVEQEIARVATCPEPELRRPRLSELAELVGSLDDSGCITPLEYNWLLHRITVAR